jgi:hypothetical protein
LRFRPWQYHAMAQRVKKSSIADPPLLLNQLVLHDGDVGCRAAEADPSKLEPEPQRFGERGRLHCGVDLILRFYGFLEAGCAIDVKFCHRL